MINLKPVNILYKVSVFIFLFCASLILLCKDLTFIVAIGLIALILFCYKVKISHFGVFIFIFAFLFRFIIILVIKTPIESDFLVQYNAAQLFSAGDMSFNTSKYFSTWGYQTGMVIFEGLLLKIWNSAFIIKIFNCLFSASINLFIFLISKEFFSYKASCCAALLYNFFVFPLTFVTVLSNSQPSAFFIFAAIYIFISQKFKSLNFLIKYSAIGTLLAIASFFRPDILIILLSFLAVFIFKLIKTFNKQNFYFVFKKVLVLFATFFILSNLFSLCVSFSGVNPIGLKNKDPLWNFVLGTNHESGGTYSEMDSNLIEEKIQNSKLNRTQAEIEIIKERVLVSPKILISLLLRKINMFWWQDCLYWALPSIQEKFPAVFIMLQKLNNGTFFYIFLLSTLGVYFALKRKSNIKFLILPFIILITFLIYLLIEVQPKYAYMVQIPIFILSAGGIEFLKLVFQKLKETELKL